MKTPTKMGIALIGLAVMLNYGSFAYASGAENPPNPPKFLENSVQGEIVKVEGEFYVVKNAAGKKVRFQVDKNTRKLDKDKTKMDRDFKVGDKIEAEVGPEGNAILIQLAMSLPPEMMGKGPSPEDLALRNLEEQQRLQARRPDEPSLYPPDFKPEIGGEKQAGPGDFPKPAFPFVKGELVLTEGEFYTIQDIEGKQVRLHVDKNTKMDCGPDFKGTCTFSIGDKIAARRTSVTDRDMHASEIRKLSPSEIKELASAITPVNPAIGDRVKDEDVSLGGAKQAVRGEVVKVEGKNYVIRDHHGSEVRVVINQNTRMWCGPETGSISGLLPEPSASDKPDATGQPQDQAGTAQQKDSDVGPGTKSSAGARMECVFKAGDKIEAEVSDMGVATFIKLAGRVQPGQPLP
jgi:alpha-acetolactate decarboxylase